MTEPSQEIVAPVEPEYVVTVEVLGHEKWTYMAGSVSHQDGSIEWPDGLRDTPRSDALQYALGHALAAAGAIG